MKKHIAIPRYRITSINLYPEDEKYLDEIKKHLSAHKNLPAIRFALKSCAEGLRKGKS